MGTQDPNELTDSQVYSHLARMIRADDPQHLHDNAAAWRSATEVASAEAQLFRREAAVIEGAWRDRTGQAIVAALHAHAKSLDGEVTTYQNNYEKMTNAGHALTEAQVKLDRIDASLPPADKATAAKAIIVALDGDYQLSDHGLASPTSREAANDATVIDSDPAPGGDPDPGPGSTRWPDATRSTPSPVAGPGPTPVSGPGPSAPINATPQRGPDLPHAPGPSDPINATPQRGPDMPHAPGDDPGTGGLAGAGPGPLTGVGPTPTGGTGGLGSGAVGPLSAGSGIGEVGAGRPGVITPGAFDGPTRPQAGLGSGVRPADSGLGSRLGRASSTGAVPGVPGTPGSSGGGQGGQRPAARRWLNAGGENPFAQRPGESGPPSVIGKRRRKDEPEEPGSRLWEEDDHPLFPELSAPGPELLGMSPLPVEPEFDEDDWWEGGSYAEPDDPAADPEDDEGDGPSEPPTAEQISQLERQLGVGLVRGDRDA